MLEYENMVRQYRSNVDETIDNIDENFRKGDIEYCIKMLTAVIKIGRLVGDEETIEFLKELLLTIMLDEKLDEV